MGLDFFAFYIVYSSLMLAQIETSVNFRINYIIIMK